MERNTLRSVIFGIKPATKLRLTLSRENPSFTASRVHELNIIRFHLDQGDVKRIQYAVKHGVWESESDRIVMICVNSMFDPREFEDQLFDLLDNIEVV